jgi:hypothetical protein
MATDPSLITDLELEPLSYIIDTHWGLQYWEPMKKYFGCNN